MNLKDSHSAISSPVSADGALPCDLQDGRMTDLFGQVVAHASHSVQRDKKKDTATSVTYGRIGLGSLESAALQKSLESRLREQLPLDGWMKSLMTWKRKRTPALRQYCQLAVSELPIEGIGSGLWPTPRAQKNNHHQRSDFTPNLAQRAMEAHAAMWPTPRAFCHKDAKTDRGKGNLGEIVNHMAMWLTPSANEDAAGTVNGKMQKMLTHQAKEANLNGSCAQTESHGQLNVEFVCWLMGYSTAHLSSMRLAMQSYRKSRQNLSKQLCDSNENST
jgi:hypothetical protein